MKHTTRSFMNNIGPIVLGDSEAKTGVSATQFATELLSQPSRFYS